MQSIKSIMSNKKGITLVALIATIIVLMILAAVTISLILGKNGIIEKAEETKKMTINDEVATSSQLDSLYVEMKNTEAASNASGDITAPTNIAPTLTATTNSIVTKCNQTDNGSGIASIQYAIKVETGDYSEWQTNNDFTGLTQNTNYTVKTKATDRAGNSIESKEASITTGTVPGLTKSNTTFIYTPISWTNENVTVGINTTVTGYTLQYSTDGNRWNTYISAITVTSNQPIYARLYDKTNYGETVTGNITNIDKVAPTDTTPTLITTTNSITVTNKQVDNESGIAGIQYAIKLTSGSYGSWQTSNVFSGLTQNASYTIKTKTTDKAGNSTESKEASTSTGMVPELTSANTTFIYTPSSWTNGNVIASISTTVIGYTLQYSLGDTSHWTNYSGNLTVTSNQTIYARLYDGTNCGGTVTGNITNIDKIAPTDTAPTLITTTNSITVTNKQVDNESGISSVQYAIKLASGSYGSWQTNNIFNGLTQNTSYTVKTKTTDKAGNSTESNETSITTLTLAGLTSANTKFTYTPSNWTNEDITVGINTTTTGYILQYSTDGIKWNTYTSAITATSNQTIYARLYDGINCGGATTGNVANIDRTNPTLVLNQDTNIETRTITISAKDPQSGINAIQYNNGGIWQNLTINNITDGKSATYGATANGTYIFRTIDNAGNITSQSITVTGVAPTVSNSKGGEILSSTDNTAIKDDNKNIVTIPAGFKIASDSATKEEDGIVIEDKDGNQYVWIPVTDISNYARTDFGENWSSYNDFSEAMPSDEQTSVNEYHGYYIGRYEAGDAIATTNKTMRAEGASTKNRVTIKKGQTPYNYVTRDQAKTLATGISAIEGYHAITKLSSSYAWDTALNFIQNKVPNYAKISPQGNYKDTTFNYTDITGTTQIKPASSSVLTPTGQTTPECNIYDMGSNDWDWTTETNANTYVARGGDYGYSSSECPAGFRGMFTTDYTHIGISFRVTLYISPTTILEAKDGGIISYTDNTEIKDDNNNIITIPAGFKVASDSATKEEDGVVIEDKDGNQFVWVPVSNISNYKRINFGAQDGSYSNYSETMPSDEQTSVSAYHGYYIGRYEAGDSISTADKTMRGHGASATSQVAIKKGQAPYNYVIWDQANTLAIRMKTVEGYNAETKLCSSYAWDTAINFMQNKVSDYGTNSGYGNHGNTTFTYTDITGVGETKPLNSGVLVPTGQTVPVCNIYDISGNEWEWTTEACNIQGHPHTIRGGDYGATCIAGYRGYPNFDPDDYYAFRITLYL